jgi:hypothetical protein
MQRWLMLEVNKRAHRRLPKQENFALIPKIARKYLSLNDPKDNTNSENVSNVREPERRTPEFIGAIALAINGELQAKKARMIPFTTQSNMPIISG